MCGMKVEIIVHHCSLTTRHREMHETPELPFIPHHVCGPQDPQLLEGGFLADIVAARQLFAFHLPDMCTAKSPSSALFNSIAESAHTRGSILSVLGYFSAQEVCPISPAMPVHRVFAPLLSEVRRHVLDLSWIAFQVSTAE